MHRGVALLRGKVMGSGSCWGEDVIISRLELRSRFCARAMNYLELHSVSRSQLFELVDRYPITQAKIKQFAVRFAMHREMVRQAKIIKAKRAKAAAARKVSLESVSYVDADVAYAFTNKHALDPALTQLRELRAEQEEQRESIASLNTAVTTISEQLGSMQQLLQMLAGMDREDAPSPFSGRRESSPSSSADFGGTRV